MFNKYYQDELTYLRQLGAEFAAENPTAAAFLAEPGGRESEVKRLSKEREHAGFDQPGRHREGDRASGAGPDAERLESLASLPGEARGGAADR